MSRIERVYIATHREDVRFTRVCVASVRRWYPAIPIFLIKDQISGRFSTREIERRWDVQVWRTAEHVFGWGFAKLEPLFDSEPVRYLMLDSDIVFLGKVLDLLAQFEEDFVVHAEQQPEHRITPLYFDLAKLRDSVDPAFPAPRFTFNTGQYVATSGILKRAHFDALVSWTQPRRVRFPAIFNPSEQGILNYVVLKGRSAGAVSVREALFMRWAADSLTDVRIDELGEGSQHRSLIHWAGVKARRFGDMPRADILDHFEAAYYARVPGGLARREVRHAVESGEYLLKRAVNLARRLRRTATRSGDFNKVADANHG